ncbi:cytochrome P450 71A9-like [Phalaenopsis equestris]|uniref:cytochrome P450 71A9-like n=1 Tax=Phalaenopsis equestris TaxID=78828 RepID=UPI0009E3A9DE|nr:cytochrome P450 71A9-like [Phalaenopsis equestris]
MAMEQAFLFLFPLFLVFSLFLPFLAKLSEAERRKKIPPGPWPLPILGNLHLLDPQKPHLSLLNLSNKHGPLIFLQLGSIPTLVISSRDIAEEIFTNHDLTFSGRPQLITPKKLLYNCSSIAFAPHNDQWRQARKIAMFELLNPRRVRSFEVVRREEVEKLMATINDLPVANLSELTLSLTNSVICRAALGDDFGDGGYSGKGGVSVHQLLSETQSLLGGFCAADFFPIMGWVDRLRGFHGRLEKNFEEMDKFFGRIIQEHLISREKEEGNEASTMDGGEEHNDFVNVLLRLHKDAVRHGGFLSNIDHVKAILVEAFIAGTDTASATITWTMTELMRNPRVMNKVQAELKQITNGKSHGFIQENELDKLEYLKQVIKETMRLRPPVPLLLPRETIQPCEIRGYTIPANTRVIINAAAISTDPNVWERPLEFWPERFDGSRVDFKGHDFQLLPFGSGRRKCPGISFAMVIVELALANLLHSFDWSLPGGMKVEDINMDSAVGITTHKKEPLCLVAKPKW